MAEIRTVPPSEWPALAAFIHTTNRRADGGVRCLHAQQGDSVEAHAQELRALPVAEACFVAAHADGTLTGVAGAELDSGRRRTWVRGPLTRDDDPALRLALLDALRAAMPQAGRFDAFPSVDELPLRASLRAAGFVDLAHHHVLALRAAAAPPAWPAQVHAPDDIEAAAAASLHDRLFPATYLDGAALRIAHDDRRLFVVGTSAGAGADTTLAGYVCVRDDPLANEGYIDFLGVDERQRGLGIGRALLAAAVQWSVAQRGRPQVSLTVRQANAPALGLYEAAGFRELSAGAQMVFERDDADALTPP